MSFVFFLFFFLPFLRLQQDLYLSLSVFNKQQEEKIFSFISELLYYNKVTFEN